MLPDENDGALASARGPHALRPEEVGKGETEDPKRSGGDEISPAEPVTEAPGWTGNSQHENQLLVSSTKTGRELNKDRDPISLR